MKKILIAIIVAVSAFSLSAQIEKGYRGFANIGYGISTTEITSYFDGSTFDVSNYLTLTTTHGYQLVENYLFVGAGLGIEYWHEASCVSMPLFADIRSDFYTTGKFSIFADAKIGYRVLDVQGFTFDPQVGGRFAISDKLGINVGIGYNVYTVKDVDGSAGAVTIKVGVDF